jgi:hypothetical protein
MFIAALQIAVLDNPAKKRLVPVPDGRFGQRCRKPVLILLVIREIGVLRHGNPCRREPMSMHPSPIEPVPDAGPFSSGHEDPSASRRSKLRALI